MLPVVPVGTSATVDRHAVVDCLTSVAAMPAMVMVSRGIGGFVVQQADDDAAIGMGRAEGNGA